MRPIENSGTENCENLLTMLERFKPFGTLTNNKDWISVDEIDSGF